MGKHHFWKVTLGLMILSLEALAGEAQFGTLSEGACWYENKELLKVASFNDKTAYLGTKEQIEANLESLMTETQHHKISDVNLALHCGGYGASLVARVTTESNTYCLWTKLEKGKLSLRSIGVVSDTKSSALCDGYKWGELIIGVNSIDLISELQSAKWATIIKEVTPITGKTYKVKLVKDYEFKEADVINLLEENFTGKNLIRYIEFNDYRHPIGEYVPLK